MEGQRRLCGTGRGFSAGLTKPPLDGCSKNRYTKTIPNQEVIPMNEHEHDELLDQLAQEYEPELLTLETQDGGELTLEVLSQLSYGGIDYLVAAEYTQEEQESTALYFFEIKEEALYPVEDEELLDTLLEIFSILNEDEEE